MRKKNKNYAGLLLIPLLAVISGAYYFAHVNWFSRQTVRAAITLGTETQMNNTAGVATQKTSAGMDADGNTVYVWDAQGHPSDATGVFSRRFDKNNTALDAADVLVNTSTTGTQDSGSVAMDENGNFVIVWSGAGNVLGEGDTQGVFVQAYQSDGTAIGSEKRVNTTTANDQRTPRVAIDYDGPTSGNNTRFVVSWTGNNGTDDDIYFQRFDVDFVTPSAPVMAGTETVANTHPTGSQDRSDVAMNNLGEFMITWFGEGPTGVSDVWYRVYAADGTAIGAAETKANTGDATFRTSAAADKMPRPSLDDANERRFILAYEVNFDGINDDIAARRVLCSDPNTSNGTDTDLACSLDSTEIIVPDSLTATQTIMDVDADYLGNFTIAWRDSAIDGNSDGVAAQSFNYLGKRVGSNFTVNTTTAGNQVNPSVAMNTDGFYSITFTQIGAANNYFQNFVTEIFKTNSETLAHGTSVNNQANGNVAVAPNGNIAAVWKDYTANTIQLTLRQFNPANNPPDYSDLLVDATVSSGGNVDNPQVSFFQDTGGTGIGTFVVVWESDVSGDKDIYYKIYNADGTVETSATAISSSVNIQTNPTVAAGYYNPGGTGSGPAIKEFSVGWIDETALSLEAGYQSAGAFTFNQLGAGACVNCVEIEVAVEPTNQYVVYTAQADDAGLNEVYIQQTIAGALSGSGVQVSPAPLNNGDPDVAFISPTNYIVTYTEITSGTTADVYGRTYEFSAGGPTNAGTRFDLTQFPASTDTEFSTAVAGDTQNNRFLAVWADSPTTATDDFIFGQFYDFTAGGGTNVVAFGPTFRINSTASGNQGIPNVAGNSSGQFMVSWEGNFNQGGGSDSNAVIYQLLQDPQNPQAVLELTPTAQQEVQAGGQFLDVPTTITFPTVSLSATDSTVQNVSVRDATYGGDTKYVEIQDATGVDFTFTVQAGDFFSTSDGKSYIKNDQHFKVKNWDNDLTDINVGNCDNALTPTDPDMCFQTVESTVTPTAFTLNAATQNFVFADTQVVLAEKQGTVNNEIGRWRIFPTFEITVPPLIPPGAHNAQITFTLT